MSDMEAILESGAALGLEYAASRLASQGKPPANCANCGAPLVGPYCAMCGQEPDMHRRTVASLAHDLVSDIANFDSRILRTAKALLFQPGELPRAFHEGRTRRYVPALRLYFFVTLIFFVILSASGIAILQFQVVAAPVKIFHDAKGGTYFINPAYDPNNAEGKAAPRLIPVPQEKAGKSNELYWFTPLPRFFRPTIHSSSLTPAMRRQLAADERLAEAAIAERGSAAGKKRTAGLISWLKEHVYTGIERLAANPAALNEPLTNWIPRALFLMLPVYALLLAIFYWRQRKTFYLVDHLTFSLSVHSFTFVALIVAVGLAQVISGGLVFWLFLLAVGTYVLLSIRRFYRQSWFWTSVKTLAISGIYTLFFLLPAMFGIVAYTFLYS
jgi:hypothetical protein